MTRFITYTLAPDYEPIALTEEEFQDQGIPDNYEDYIWHENATSKEQACTGHNDRLDEYMGR